MLHSTLPRAFLAPGLNYFAGYYGDQIQYAPSYMTLGAEEYSRIADHHVLPSWDVNSRSSTPCPLDLSLKPSNTPKIEESIEVDDEEDRRSREELQKRARYVVLDNEEEELVVDDHQSSSYDPKNSIDLDRTQSSRFLMEQKYQHSKINILNPLQNYQQQLLLTPQHQGVHSPMTPPSTPSPPQCPRRRHRDEDTASPKQINTEKQIPRKKKHARRLKFDEDTSSPVSGTVILGPDEAVVTGDIDPAFNIVEVTDEARAELAKIENRLGPYQCKLCRQLHDDAFQLAQHRCSRIAHVEYRCPECDKRFSCPANLASHRRWHKPRVPNDVATNSSLSVEISCTRCDAKFTRQAALRKHLATQHPEVHNNNNSSNSNNNNSSINNNNNNNENNGLEVKTICSPVQIVGSPLNIEMP